MNDIELTNINECWCGSKDLAPYSVNYVRCTKCNTLINSPRQITQYFDVESDDNSFYGKNYWLNHQSDQFGYSDIFTRTREDLTQRCLHWLNTILKYRLPPARFLELGCGPGGLVHLMKETGYDSIGLELSEWVVEYGRKTHGIDLIQGKIEDVDFPSESRDIVAMMDVIEHFTDPVSTMTIVEKVLKKDGLLIIQTPCFTEQSLETLKQTESVFLSQFKDQEHLYLFTKNSITQLLQSVGFTDVIFKPALFPYDMFVIASKQTLNALPQQDVDNYLESSPDSRVILALLDLYKKQVSTEKEANLRLESINRLENWLKESETDRDKRLQMIDKLGKQLQEIDKDRNDRLEVISLLEERLRESEQDRAARLEVIHSLEQRIHTSENEELNIPHTTDDFSKDAITLLEQKLIESENDPAARLDVIRSLESRLQDSDKDRQERLVIIEQCNDTIANLEKENSEIRKQLDELRNSLEDKSWLLKQLIKSRK